MTCSRLPAAARLAGGLEHIVRLGAGVLKGSETCALRVGRMQPGVDLRSRPVRDPGLRSAAGLGERAAGFPCRLAALVLSQRVEPDLLLVVQQAVKVLQWRLYRADRGNHCF